MRLLHALRENEGKERGIVDFRAGFLTHHRMFE
jgi:hypothetical protein